MEKGFTPIVPLHWFGYGYTALVTSGGIFGYVKTGRVPSLVVGLFFGSLAGLGSYQLSQDPKNVWLFLAATSGTFASVMALRSYYHGKVMPVGLIAGARCRWLAFLLSSALLLHLSEEPQVAAAGEGFSFLFSPTATTLTCLMLEKIHHSNHNTMLCG
ncbi:transmembrane protein 14B-like isoform X9 [Sapajus apella]|uniref:Transmembrane protein 14B-like isoform X9 n=1 Tax=Sapajus apella TaxID=9515 RepID=A0A6J3FKC8_SAPAP|nr:transmembrane protein 14B-like isoform X9 [Sapajus apella]XP_032105876.1 transmembrane protein 14B-like isoform X9 [Sapajus apella]